MNTRISPAPKVTDSLFFAVMPDAPAIARIEALMQRVRAVHGLRGKAMEPERLHVTLHHLGSHAGVPGEVLRQAEQAAQAVVAQPFEITFDRVASFAKPRNSPLVLQGGEGVAGVEALQQTLGRALHGAGLGARVQPRFTPHLTLMYDDACVPEEPVEPVGWTVHEFVLVRSLLGQRRHVPLARWSLGGAA